MIDRRKTLLWRIRLLLALFMTCLVLSGLTAVPLEWEVGRVADALGIPENASPDAYTGLRYWIATVREGLKETYARYPFIAYGTDWLAFAHVVIAIAFIGPLIDPVRNAWVITFGMIACVLVIPMALVFGPLRGIPFYWRLIDCSFGVLGFIPLWLCRKYARELAQRMSPRRGS
jgi:hypothetical protein